MSFQIPKHLKELNSLQFESLIPVTLNDFDVDRMITHLFELCVHYGRLKPSKTKPEEYEEYLKRVTASATISGLPPDVRREVLDGWIRAAVVRVGVAGKTRRGPSMDYPKPMMLSGYLSGLPKGRVRSRQADILVYDSMLRYVRNQGSTMERADVSRLLVSTFGSGLEFTGNFSDDPRYDGHSEFDINALLGMIFFSTFEPRGKPQKIEFNRPIFVKGAVDCIGRDLVSVLQFYGDAVSIPEGAMVLSALIGMRLFQLQLRTALASRTLLATGNLTSDVEDGDNNNPLQLYCDFTRVDGSASDLTSKLCVQRDLDQLRQFFTDRMFLRSIFIASQVAFQQRAGSETEDFSKELQTAVRAVESTEMQIALRQQIQQIESGLPAGIEGEIDRQFIRTLRDSGLSTNETLVRILLEALQRNGLAKQIQWFWNCGGLTKDYGLLRGTLRARYSWRYSPSDDLLIALLMACFVRKDGSGIQDEITVSELLNRLSRRFGILVDRVPEEFDTSSARTGAAENREAFVRRLRMLGFFEGLSDDFAAQYVRNPRGRR